MTKRAAIYARYSSDRQNERSIDDQAALCRAYCEREGFDVVKVYDDKAVSGASTANRFGWLALMRDARAGRFDVVVSEALDRISRDQEDLAGIHKRLRFAGIELRTVQDGLAGDIHVGVKGLLGALYLKDLAQKTKRGQAGVLRAGRHNGGKSYGYRQTGAAGVLAIDDAQAAIVRRIFTEYRGGRGTRDIAVGLNRDHVPGPRGGVWNASAIFGSRKRENGILQNSLYRGLIVWNRQTFVKDPETGRRISRPNPREEWMTSDAPDLRIIDDALWDAVQDRRAKRAALHRSARVRATHLFSGLLKCGRCGSGYVVSGRDKRGLFISCSRRRESGLCDNHRTVGLSAIEARIIEVIETQLADPDMIAEFIREFHRACNDLRRVGAREYEDRERRLKTVKAELASIVDLLLEGMPPRSLKDRMAALEAERETIEQALAQIDQTPVQFHPQAARIYQQRVRDLKAALSAADEDNRAEAVRLIRDLIEKIVILPTGPYKPFDIEIYGQLATMLQGSSPEGRNGLLGKVVAGVRNNLSPKYPRFIIAVCSA